MATDIEVKSNVSANLQRLLRDRGLTRTALAQMTGDPLMTISSTVSGKYVPNVALLSRIADALDVSIDRLISAPPEKLSAAS